MCNLILRDYLCQIRIFLAVCGSQSPCLPCRQDLAPVKHPPAFPAAGSSCRAGMQGCEGAGTAPSPSSQRKKCSSPRLELNFVSAVPDSDKANPRLTIIQFKFFSLTSIQIMCEPATLLNIALSIWSAVERGTHSDEQQQEGKQSYTCVC